MPFDPYDPSRYQTGNLNASQKVVGKKFIGRATTEKWAIKLCDHMAETWNNVAIAAGRTSLLITAKPSNVKIFCSTGYWTDFAIMAESKGFDWAVAHTDGLLIWNDKIEVVQRMLLTIKNGDPNLPILLSALTQWGKTTILVATAIFGNALLRNGSDNRDLICVNTMRKGPDCEFKKLYNRMLAFYSAFQFVAKPAEGDTSPTFYSSNPPDFVRSMKRNCGSRSNDGVSYDTKFGFLDEMQDRGREPIFLFDEGDEGPGTDGRLAKFKQECDDRGLHHQCIYVTATDEEFSSPENMQIVQAPPPGKEYCGLFFGTQYSVMSTTELALAIREKGLVDYSQYDEDCSPAVRASIKLIKVGLPRNPLDPLINGMPCQGGRGLAVRHGFKVDAERFAAACEDELDRRGIKNIKVIRYFGDDIVSNRTVKESIDQLAGQDNYYIIVFSGAARRADQFHGHLTMWIHFGKNAKSVTNTSFIQDFAGRITGYNKITKQYAPVLVVNDEMAERIRGARKHFAKTGNVCPLGKVTNYSNDVTDKANKAPRGKPSQNLYVLAEDFPEIFEKASDLLFPLLSWSGKRCNIALDEIAGVSRDIARVGPSEINGKNVLFVDPFKLFGADALNLFEETYSAKNATTYNILRPGTKANTGWRYSTLNKRFVEAHFGNDKRKGHNPNNHDGKGTATVHTGRHDLRQISIMWSKSDDADPYFQIERVTFPLCTPTKRNQTFRKTLPNETSHAYAYLTQEEQKLVQKTHKTKRTRRGRKCDY